MEKNEVSSKRYRSEKAENFEIFLKTVISDF
jgi:hypothetical protein